MDLSDDEKREKVLDLVDELSTAMLVSVDEDGDLHARPMAVGVRHEDRVLFLTHRATEKVREIRGNSSVNACFQERMRFLSVAGEAHIVPNHPQLEEIWSDRWLPWFPGGIEDPRLIVIEMKPTSAEYWDYSGMEGLKFLLAWTKAVVTKSGIDYEDTDETHGTVRLKEK